MTPQRPPNPSASEQLSLWDANVTWYTDAQAQQREAEIREDRTDGGAGDATVPALRQRVLRHAVEHEAARWANTPGIGRSGAARYIWETLQNHDDAPRDAARDYELRWIADYLRGHPEVFDLPPTKSPLGERRRELSAQADERALHAYQAGDLDGAIQGLAEAEALHPSPGKYFADAISAVRAATATPVSPVASESVATVEQTVGVPGEASAVDGGRPALDAAPRRVSVAHPRPASSPPAISHAADDAPSERRGSGERPARERLGVAPDVA